jgi:hypothetical protein
MHVNKNTSNVMQMIRSTNILVGIHGAGLMLIMFAAEEVSVPIFLEMLLRVEYIGGVSGNTSII